MWQPPLCLERKVLAAQDTGIDGEALGTLAHALRSEERLAELRGLAASMTQAGVRLRPKEYYPHVLIEPLDVIAAAELMSGAIRKELAVTERSELAATLDRINATIGDETIISEFLSGLQSKLGGLFDGSGGNHNAGAIPTITPPLNSNLSRDLILTSEIIKRIEKLKKLRAAKRPYTILRWLEQTPIPTPAEPENEAWLKAVALRMVAEAFKHNIARLKMTHILSGNSIVNNYRPPKISGLIIAQKLNEVAQLSLDLAHPASRKGQKARDVHTKITEILDKEGWDIYAVLKVFDEVPAKRHPAATLKLASP